MSVVVVPASSEPHNVTILVQLSARLRRDNQKVCLTQSAYLITVVRYYKEGYFC